MSWKEFLKPDWRKIVVLILLLIIFTVPVRTMSQSYPKYVSIHGLPFEYLEVGHDYTIESFFGITYIGISSNYMLSYFALAFFILDIILWYIISCFIFWIYGKIREKK